MAGWCLPPGHAPHSAAFSTAEKRPAAHGVHARSDVAVGGVLCFSPAAHVVCRVQKDRPSFGWYSAPPHAKHAGRSLALENVPAAHGAQARSDEAVGVVVWYWPVAHTLCRRQNAFPDSF